MKRILTLLNLYAIYYVKSAPHLYFTADSFLFFIMDFLDKSSELFVADGRGIRRCFKCSMGRITCPHCTGNGQVVNYILLSVA